MSEFSPENTEIAHRRGFDLAVNRIAQAAGRALAEGSSEAAIGDALLSAWLCVVQRTADHAAAALLVEKIASFVAEGEQAAIAQRARETREAFPVIKSVISRLAHRALEFEFADLIAAPIVSPEDCQKAGLTAITDPPADLLRIMEIQRREPDDAGRSVIGGAVVLTMITRDTIEQRVVHRWADKVGERIEANSRVGTASCVDGPRLCKNFFA
jgi:hypothetical protein